MRPNTQNRFLARSAIAQTLILGVFLIFVLAQTRDALPNHYLPVALLFMNGGLALYGLGLAMRHGAPNHYMSFMFSFLFMAIAPLIQIGAALDPVLDLGYVAALAALNALIFSVIGLWYSRRMRTALADPGRQSRPADEHFLVLFLVIVGVALPVIAIYRGDLFSSREGFDLANARLFAEPQTALLATTVFTTVPFFGATIGLRAALESRRHRWAVLYSLAFALALVINNPLIQPRFKLAGLAVFFIDYMFRKRKMQLLAAFVVVGVILAPALNAFRYEDNSASGDQIYSEHVFDQTFLSYDYDAFLTSCYAIVTTRLDGFSFGTNIAGAALFFVPRALWTAKPETTSWILFRTMEKYREVGTDNLSTPLVGEGYFAFGLAGVIFVSLVFWHFVQRMDSGSRHRHRSLLFLLRCVFSGLVLIFLRGTLIVGVSFVAGFFVSAALPWYVFHAPRRGNGR